ncbi:hypothetical protein PF008_g29914 [Phytophthora fragariae]|uniref:Uncharacterized protein n=1 Tax=Phytophthora fragariae TaxID=53985 RepID=A0A6G0Q7J5_9STRA|nr:hypothetical protein PF008_g29914 [Phytophthora fragariae]
MCGRIAPESATACAAVATAACTQHIVCSYSHSSKYVLQEIYDGFVGLIPQ